jgi:hypothetical protein
MQRRKAWCEEWPRCRCQQFVDHWIEQAPRFDDGITFEQFQECTELLLYRLMCLAEICPEPKARRWAKQQLATPFFRRERIRLTALGVRLP